MKYQFTLDLAVEVDAFEESDAVAILEDWFKGQIPGNPDIYVTELEISPPL